MVIQRQQSRRWSRGSPGRSAKQDNNLHYFPILKHILPHWFCENFRWHSAAITLYWIIYAINRHWLSSTIACCLKVHKIGLTKIDLCYDTSHGRFFRLGLACSIGPKPTDLLAHAHVRLLIVCVESAVCKTLYNRMETSLLPHSPFISSFRQCRIFHPKPLPGDLQRMTSKSLHSKMSTKNLYLRRNQSSKSIHTRVCIPAAVPLKLFLIIFFSLVSRD